ncbi:MAG: thioredoxin-dependent thiol peroxidase [Myxococcota bacterium]|nr:thioredoxin-dependent thiol peroxidase [Myxococcota bacterium]
MSLSIGDTAPDFTLDSDNQEGISLTSLRGKKVVLYFYPKDSTPGCTNQACEFRDLQEEFTERNTVVLGISKDSLKSHGNFRAKHELNFPLLSDPDLSVHKAYGVWAEKKNYGRTYMGTVRTTIVIDEGGRIAAYSGNVRAKGNAQRTLEALG